MTKTFQVLERFDPKKDYGVKIQPRFSKCLGLLQKGQVVSQIPFARVHQSELTTRKDSFANSEWIVRKSFQLGQKIGVINEVDDFPISFWEFCLFETVEYYSRQLKCKPYKNLKTKRKLHSTREQYLYRLWDFNKWIHGKTYVFTQIRHVDENTFRKEKQTVTLDNVEQFLKLYQTSTNSESDYIKVIKHYLMDDFHGNVSSGYMKAKKQAIIGYFEKNDSPINFHYDPSVLYNYEKEDMEIAKLSLEDLLNMLTTGKASLLDRAVVLCKFHRGLDNITFVDRFNFVVWEQLVKWFGTSVFEQWDLEKCPVPIVLVRIKTGYRHRGFLDIDAIQTIQKYLKYRYEKTGKPMEVGQPLFLSERGTPISEFWVQRLIPRLAKNAGIQRKFMVNSRVRKEKTSHELRDLLKSTLIANDVVQYVADLAIGHKIKDSYEKQDELYPEKSRAEYMKASRKINIFSNISHYLGGDFEKQSLHKQIQDLKQQNDNNTRKYELELLNIKSTLDKLVQNQNIKNKTISVTSNIE